MTVVVDASALLALVNGEPGMSVVSEAIPGAAISAVNLSEVIAKLTEGEMPEGEIGVSLGGLGLDVVAFDADQAYTAGLLRARTRSRGLSFGDRACITLGIKLGCDVLTADRDWAGLDLGVGVKLIR